jgi:NTE family protein
MDNKAKTVSLVLGSGGARGLAHIGIIRVLEEKGFEITSIAGCSVGALVGGIYAAGKLTEYEDWVRNLTKFDMVNMMDIAWVGGGLVKGKKIMDKMIRLVLIAVVLHAHRLQGKDARRRGRGQPRTDSARVP